MAGGWRIAIVLAALAACLSGARAESRLALVIGNSSYRAVTPLPNPVSDAKAMADELKTAGFDVTAALDVGQSDMRKAIKDFTAKVAAKGADTVALVFYAGHGVQVEGENFLIPVDARIQSEADISKEAVRLADLMSALAAVPRRMNIVILDSCRNNPFATTKQTRGLAIVDAPTGSIVAYSTAPGTEATDGAGAHSPYTAAFIEVSQQPRLQIEQLFKQVRLKVHEATKGQQTPWESSSLTSDFWFLPVEQPAPAASPAVVAAAPATPPKSRVSQPATASQPATLPPPAASAASQAATAPVTPPAPSPTQAPRQARLPAPQPVPATSSGAPQPNYAPAPAGYAVAPPPAAPAVDMRALAADDAYEYAVAEDSVAGYEEFLLVYPSDPRADWVRTALSLRVDAVAWRYASVVNTPAAYEAYLSRYPGGVYADDAGRLRLRPRLRPIDVVIAPRIMLPPPEPRLALPLIQMRRAPGMRIMLPVVLSRPGRFNNPAARFAPGQRLPGYNPGIGPRFQPHTVAPGLTGFPRDRVVTPNTGPAGLQRRTTINGPVGPAGPAGPAGPVAPAGPAGPAGSQNRPPLANATPQLQPAQPIARPANQQFRPAVQTGPKPRAAAAVRCAGRGCKR